MGNARLERGHRLLEVQGVPCHSRDAKEFPGSPLVRTPRFQYWVQSLVGEQRSCKPHNVAISKCQNLKINESLHKNAKQWFSG